MPSRVPGHAQGSLLWGEKAISLFICPAKTSSGNRERREEVFRVAEGAALKSEQGHRLLPAEPQRWPRAPWGGRSSRRVQSHLHVTSRPAATAQTCQEPGGSVGAAKSQRARVRAGGSPMSWGTGQHLPPGLPRASLRKSGKPRAPGDPRSSGLPSPGTGCFIPWDSLRSVHG